MVLRVLAVSRFIYATGRLLLCFVYWCLSNVCSSYCRRVESGYVRFLSFCSLNSDDRFTWTTTSASWVVDAAAVDYLVNWTHTILRQPEYVFGTIAKCEYIILAPLRSFFDCIPLIFITECFVIFIVQAVWARCVCAQPLDISACTIQQKQNATPSTSLMCCFFFIGCD